MRLHNVVVVRDTSRTFKKQLKLFKLTEEQLPVARLRIDYQLVTVSYALISWNLNIMTCVICSAS